MCKRLIKEMRPDKRGKPRAKWVRPPGAMPPSQESSRRREHYRKVRLQALAAFGHECLGCGCSDGRVLQIDHIQGDGGAERRRYRGVSYYYHILKDPDPKRYQVLCANCNIIKREEEKG